MRFSGKVVSIFEATFRGPNKELMTREIARHPGAVCMVPLDGSIVTMVRQYRCATDEYLLEIPAGKRDLSGEPPEQTAQRELIEEVGLRAGELQLLGEFYNSPGFCDEYSFCYLATNCVAVPDSRQGLEEEYMEVIHIDLEDVTMMIAEKRIVDAKSILGLMLAKEHIR
tara:strand:+ start:592 stop:1098 length:507 start_codon:yes stop_codon:yes gene_type:complete